MLKQLGLLPEFVEFPYQVEGAEGKRVEVRLPVVGAEGKSGFWRKDDCEMVLTLCRCEEVGR